MISRRQVVCAAATLATGFSLQRSAAAQQRGRTYRLGVLMALAQDDPETTRQMKGLERGLRDSGWTPGSNLRIDYRWAAGDPTRMREAASELVAIGPDIILTGSTPALAAVRQTGTILPVVFVGVSDPIRQGFVTSLAHPGGNLTGFSNFEPSMSGKWLQILKSVAPQIDHLLFMFNPATAPFFELFVNSLQTAAPSFGIEIIVVHVHDHDDIERTMATQERRTGMLILPDVFAIANREQIVALAARHRIPAIYALRPFTVSGGLITYSVDIANEFQRAASYVDRILKGASPGDLPVQNPIKFELVINLKAAKNLGLTIPAALLAQADELIE